MTRKDQVNGEGIAGRRHTAKTPRTRHPRTTEGQNPIDRQVVQIRPERDRDARLSNKPKNRGSLPQYLWGGAVLGAWNIGEGLAGLYDSNLRGLINPNAQRTGRGTPRQKFAAVTAIILTGVLGEKVIPPVIEATTPTAGEEFVQNMYTNKVPDGAPGHDGVLPTRIKWVVESYGPEGANVLSQKGIDMIELVGTFPSKSDYKDERQKVEAGFTALDRIADIVSAQGKDEEGNIRGFNLSDNSEAQLSGTFAGYVQDAIDADMVDNEILGSDSALNLSNLSPNQLLQVFGRTPDAELRADYLLGHGRDGHVPAVGPAFDLTS